MRDLILRRQILDELEFVPHIDAAAIGVSIEDGVVVLSGHVRTYAEKIAAEHAVKSVKGVRAVAEELEVRAGSTRTRLSGQRWRSRNWAIPPKPGSCCT